VSKEWYFHFITVIDSPSHYSKTAMCHMMHIQGDSGGICKTSGNDSMCDSKQKSSYEHGSDFERLRSYDRLKLRIEGNNYWQ